MEDFDKIKSNITSYIIKKYNIQLPEKYIGVHLESVGGLSNTNYVATITNKTTNERIGQILYRKYGEISDVVDRDLETMIINDLAQKGIGPKIYEKDPNGKYRIDEYIANTSPINKKDEFDPLVIKQVIQIVNNYNLIMNVYKYNINNDKINVSIVKDGSSQAKVRINNNMYDKCMNEMYNKAIKAFNIFSEEFKNNLPRESNKALYFHFDNIEKYMINFKDLFNQVFPKNGYMILCHNDIHRLNLIIRQNDKKIFLLDYEYACLNLIGNDFANYMNESCYIYENNYQFTKEKIDFEKYYNLYKLYINEFINTHKFMNNIEECKLFLNEIQTKKYYLKLHCVINLFWFLYCVIYLDFEELNKDKKNFFYFIHCIHRMYHFESAKNEINNIN